MELFLQELTAKHDPHITRFGLGPTSLSDTGYLSLKIFSFVLCPEPEQFAELGNHLWYFQPFDRNSDSPLGFFGSKRTHSAGRNQQTFEEARGVVRYVFFKDAGCQRVATLLLHHH